MRPRAIFQKQATPTLNKLTVALGEIADNVMVTDAEGVIEYVNAAFERTTGYTKMDVCGQTPRILNSGRHPQEFFKKLWDTLRAGKPFHATVINKKKNGEIYYADQMISPIKSFRGKITHFVSVWHDITPHVHLEQQLIDLNRQLNLQKNKLEQVLQIENGLQQSLNLYKMIDFAIEKAVAILGVAQCSFMQADQVSGAVCVKGHHGIDEERIDQMDLHIGDNIARLMLLHGEEWPLLESSDGKVGQMYRSKGFLSIPIFACGRLFGLINVSGKNNVLKEFDDTDVSLLNMVVRQLALAVDNARLHSELNFWQTRDAQLNVYNYRHCCRVLDYEINRLRRYGGDLSVMLINVDGFRQFNEIKGEREGDKLLQDFGRMLQLHLRDVDIVCRYVGDEFLVILPQTSQDSTRVVAEKLSLKCKFLSGSFPITASFGVAQWKQGLNRHDLIRKADSALSLAKKNGKGQVAVAQQVMSF